MLVRSSHNRAHRRLAAAAGLGLLAAVALGGCSATDGTPSVSNPFGGDSESATPNEPQVTVRTNLPKGKKPVKVSTLLSVAASDGTLQKVRFATAAGDRVPGEMRKQDTRWVATERLEPGTRYTVTAVGVDEEGLKRPVKRTFRTEDLTLDQQTYASIAPVEGETVGVGMPVIVQFDIPVTDRAEIEKHLSVDTSPQQVGSWHWISDNEVHWRPKEYWKPGTDVTVNADINGVDAGNGIYGQEDRTASFRVGDAVIMKVNVPQHEMKVYRNGQLLRTIPISAGKPGFTTRSGIKVIIEKFREKRMDAATTGISEDDPEYYNIEDVEYAQRVTYSGEFLHAAPWSVGSQGSANVSHGCVGMGTDNAAWLYGLTHRGDIVDVTGTDRRMEATNGFGDWNVSWADYRAGSALR